MHQESINYGNPIDFNILDSMSTYQSSCPPEIKCFDIIENAASEITYRCPNCRKCQKCKHGEHIQYTSIKEEVEQDVINQSVTINFELGKAEAKLPFMESPISKLQPNKQKAIAVFNSQLKRLSKN